MLTGGLQLQAALLGLFRLCGEVGVLAAERIGGIALSIPIVIELFAAVGHHQLIAVLIGRLYAAIDGDRAAEGAVFLRL